LRLCRDEFGFGGDGVDGYDGTSSNPKIVIASESEAIQTFAAEIVWIASSLPSSQ
jgi:hypothetical protein